MYQRAYGYSDYSLSPSAERISIRVMGICLPFTIYQPMEGKMNSSTSNTPAVTPVPQIRNELGRFAEKLSTPATIVRQAQVDANVNHWQWLSRSGYFGIEPSEIFSGIGR
jgi:hypothetical protein